MKKRAAAGGVQMFSFLDAMICTLGALLVLLHAFARDREIDAVKKSEAKAAEQATIDVKAELETLGWRIEQLREVRTKTEAQLADERLKLAHVEDHERRLQEKFEDLKIAAGELERLNESKDAKTLRNQAELEAAKIRLAKAKDELEQAHKDAKHAASYNIVPYDGPYGTRRRPIYIECRAESMILQPEGVELVPEDFAGFLGAGNPLASALRGASEYHARQAVSASQTGEPYPLLLVRPEGIMTYYAARSALGSWGADFGYELIGSDWQLKFPPQDERLGQLLRQIVADSRMRMREPMAATSQLNARRQKVALRASTNGGFVTDRRYSSSGAGGRGAGSFESMESSWLSGKSSKPAHRAPEGDGGGGLGSNRSGAGGFGNGNGGTTPFAGDGGGGVSHDPRRLGGLGDGTLESATMTDGSATSQRPGRGSARPGNGYGGATSESGGLGQDPAGPGMQGGNAPYGAVTSEQSGGRFNATSDGAGGQDNSATAAPPAGLAAGAAGGSSEASSHAAMSAGENSAGSGAGKTAHGTGGQPDTSAMSQGATEGGGSSAGGQPSQGGQSHMSAHVGNNKAQSLAKRRGRDWGLQDADSRTSPVTRPVLVQCHADKLVIVPEDRTQQAVVIALDGAAEESIDEFVVNVWKHTRQWGIAGKGLFWKPMLVMDVARDGNDRFAEIQALLADSGLEVRRRNARRATTAAAPNDRR